jgi:hypothetical protein
MSPHQRELTRGRTLSARVVAAGAAIVVRFYRFGARPRRRLRGCERLPVWPFTLVTFRQAAQ